MIKRILVGLAGTSHSPSVIHHAVALARRHGASLTGLALADPELFVRLPQGVAREDVSWWLHERVAKATEHIADAMQGFAEACDNAGVSFRVPRSDREPIDMLVSESRYHDLVVCGLQGWMAVGLTSDPKATVVKALRRGVGPVLAVAEEPRDVCRVAVAYSGSPEAARSMRQFVQLGLWQKAEVSVFCFERPADEAAEVLRKAARYLEAHGIDAQIAPVPQTAATEGILQASLETDLVVMGDGAHKSFASRLLGSTVADVVREVKVPLFLSH